MRSHENIRTNLSNGNHLSYTFKQVIRTQSLVLKANGNEQTTRETELSIQSNKLVFIRGEEGGSIGEMVKGIKRYRLQQYN